VEGVFIGSEKIGVILIKFFSMDLTL